MTNIFDTHFHLTATDCLEDMVNDARRVGVEHMLIAGAEPHRIANVVTAAVRTPSVYCAVGVHPHQADEFDGQVGMYRDLIANHADVRAIGEIGLDYHYNYAAHDVQKSTFRAFLELAGECQLPVIIHCRDAWDDCATMLANNWQRGMPFVIHCFTGTIEWAERFLDMGGYLSFNGIITFKRADDVRSVLQQVPHNRIFFETDSPYLAPVPFRGKPNAPAMMPYIIEHAAQVLSLDAQRLADITTANARQFFGIRDDN